MANWTGALTTALLNGTVIAAVLVAVNGYLFSVFTRRLTTENERLKNALAMEQHAFQATLARGSFAFESAYKREEQIYIEVWPIINDMTLRVELGDQNINDEFLPADRERVRLHSKDLQSKLGIALKKVEDIRPLIPSEIVALLDRFATSALAKRNSWEYPALYKAPLPGAPPAEEIRRLATEIEDWIRVRMSALQGSFDPGRAPASPAVA